MDDMNKKFQRNKFIKEKFIQSVSFSRAAMRYRPLRILFFCVIALTSACSLIFDRTISWKESVNLISGESLAIERSVTFGPSWIIKRGEGSIKSQKILFTYKGEKIVWATDETWPTQYLPLSLEIVDGDPVVLMPVDSWRPCYKYNFPPEGIIAFQSHAGKWKESSAQGLSKEIRVNLVQSYHALRYYKDFKPDLIGESEKKFMERYVVGPKQHSTLAEVIAHQQHPEDACIKIRPPANPEMEEARQQNADAERNAKLIDAELVSTSEEPEIITGEMWRQQIGMSHNIGRWSKQCQGVVNRVEFLDSYSGNGNQYSSGLSSYQITLENPPNTKIQIEEISRGQFQFVECDQEYIYVVRRSDKEGLIIHRFEHGGSLVDALRIKLPNIGDLSSGGQWGWLWLLASNNNQDITLSIVDYDYETVANDGGVIKRRLEFLVHAPTI